MSTYHNNIVPKLLARNGKASWASTVKPLSSDNTGGDDWDASPGSIPLAITHFYKCPMSQCDKVEPSTCKEFQYCDLDRRRKCFGCHKASPVRDWMCSCGNSWFRCPMHCACNTESTSSHSSQVQAKLPASSSKPCKRKVGDGALNYDALLSEDLENERKWARTVAGPTETITLGDVVSTFQVPTKLGAVLSRRFGYLMHRP